MAYKALRIIDQLTAALEAAEKNLQSRMHCRYCDEGMTCELYTELESRAEALQARVAELESQDARTAELLAAEHATSIRCQSELATTKARVAELEAQSREGNARADAAEAELADLRGRVERAVAIAKEDRNLPILEAIRGR